MEVRVLASGVDTLELWTAKGLTPAAWALVQAAQRAAVDSNTPTPVVVGPLELRASPRWRNAALLESDLYALRVEPDARSTGATVRVEVRALALWARGWREAAATAVEALAALCGGPEGLEVQVGRVDVCVDFQGWVPSPDERHAFVCRARKRARYFEEPHAALDNAAWCDAEARRLVGLARQLEDAGADERRELLALVHRPAAPHREAEYDAGRHLTGFAFGVGAPLSARLYDKTREVAVSRKGWFRRVWGAGRDESAPVWRLEFQLRREALRTFRLSREGYTEDLGAWERLRPRLDEVWRYLTRQWLRHGGRTAETRRVLSPAWEALADGYEGAARAVDGLHRAALEGASAPVTAALAGYLTTAAAQHAELRPDAPREFSRVVAEVLRAAWDYTEEKKGPPEDVAQGKRALLQARRRQLDAHARAQAAERFERRRLPRGKVTPGRGLLFDAAGAPVRLVGPEGAVYVARTAEDDAREAHAATARALEQLEALRREREAEARKWTVDELA